MKSIKRYRVSGRVQGVGYRFFVVQQSAGLAVDGWVRNMVDGTVEALVAGSEDAHSKMRLQLEDGPRHAHVASVSVVEESECAVDEGFMIRPDGF